MNRLVIACALVGLSGCVTGTSVVRRDKGVTLPMLFGALAADFFVTSAAALYIEDYSTGASLATGGAVTAADLAVGCLLGGCAALRP